MSTYDNAPPPDGWVPEPRCCPFTDCGICETPQHAVFIHRLADLSLDGRGDN